MKKLSLIFIIYFATSNSIFAPDDLANQNLDFNLNKDCRNCKKLLQELIVMINCAEFINEAGKDYKNIKKLNIDINLDQNDRNFINKLLKLQKFDYDLLDLLVCEITLAKIKLQILKKHGSSNEIYPEMHNRIVELHNKFFCLASENPTGRLKNLLNHINESSYVEK